jgi:UDP-3-O-[3-hydroxymyristoyl] glucosamine N-acyltransferase
MTDVSVAAIAELVGGRLIGDGMRRITGLGDLRTAGPDRIGFVRHARYHTAAGSTRAGALLSATEITTSASQIVVPDVDVAYAKVASLFHPLPKATEHSIHATAVVDAGAELEAPVQIGPRAVIGRCRIGAGTVVMAGVSIGDGCEIGRDCVFHPNATLYPGVQIGDRVVAHATAVIGADGFGYAREGSTWLKVPQLGGVLIEDDVEIGAGTTIDRGTLGLTRVGARTKMDNLCHVAHNCVVGSDVIMAAGVMVAGSTTIGDRCVFGGNVGISGHIEIAADVRLGGGTITFDDVPEAGDYLGHPIMKKRQFLRLLRILRGLVEKPPAPPG